MRNDPVIILGFCVAFVVMVVISTIWNGLPIRLPRGGKEIDSDQGGHGELPSSGGVLSETLHLPLRFQSGSDAEEEIARLLASASRNSAMKGMVSLYGNAQGMCSELYLVYELDVPPLWQAQGMGEVIFSSVSLNSEQLSFIDLSKCYNTLGEGFEKLHLFGVSEQSRDPLTVFAGLGLALLLRYQDRGEVDSIYRESVSHVFDPQCRGDLRVFMRFQSQLKIVYRLSLLDSVSAASARTYALQAHNYISYLVDRLSHGDLLIRCLEHLEDRQDMPPGVKDLSAKFVVGHPARVGQISAQKLVEVIKQSHQHFTFQELFDAFGQEHINLLSDEMVNMHGRREFSSALVDELLHRRTNVDLLRDFELCWELRKKILQRILIHDEGLALCGPNMMKEIELAHLPDMLGFLSRYGSSVLWSAPWFKKALLRRFHEMNTPESWNDLYDTVWGDEDTIQGDFQSIQAARELILEVAYELEFTRPFRSAFWKSPGMSFLVMCWSAQRGNFDREKWRIWTRMLDVSMLERVAQLSWMWNGEPFLLLYSVVMNLDSLKRTLSQGQKMILNNLYQVACKRDCNRYDDELFHGLLPALLELSDFRINGENSTMTYAGLATVYTNYVERKELVSVSALKALNTLQLNAPARHKGILMTSEQWLDRLKLSHHAGGLSVSTHESVRGGLSLDES